MQFEWQYDVMQQIDIIFMTHEARNSQRIILEIVCLCLPFKHLQLLFSHSLLAIKFKG